MTPALHADDPGGPEPLLVLVHGAMDRSTSFARAARALAADAAVMRYDRRGYGRSAAVGPGDLSTHARDLIELLGGRRAVVVGHSFGGLVALLAASGAPDSVIAVGAYEPPTPWWPWWPAASRALVEDPDGAAESFMRHHIGDGSWERLPRRWRDARRAEGASMAAELLSIHGVEIPPGLSTVGVPVLMGHGTGSAPHQIRGTVDLAALLPHARVMALAGARHDAPTAAVAAYAEFARAAFALARIAER